MQFARGLLAGCALVLLAFSTIEAQQMTSTPAAAAVPQLVNYSGKAADLQGKPLAGSVGISFSIYSEQYEGAPLWLETQNVTADAQGNYTVQLGGTTSAGLPLELFSTGEARWLGVRINGGEEQPRVLLLSVPYALKAADAQTLGGLPASAFMLAAPSVAASNAGPSNMSMVDGSTTGNTPPPASSGVTTTGGAVNAVPLFTTATNVQSSILTQSGTTVINVGGKLNLPAAGAATASKGFVSRPLDFVASSFNSGTPAPVPQTFQWQAEPANNNTANPSAVLSLLYGSGTMAPAETGLRIGPKGILGFAPGQTFPGTIASVKAGTGLTGGGTSGSVTLNLDTTKVPLLAASNTFTGNQTVNGNLSATGTVAGSSFQIGSYLFGFGSYNNSSAYLGFEGNTTSTGLSNTGIGEYALATDTYGASNTAIGNLSLYQNTTGYSNTATGVNALYANTTGTNNTATGFSALQSNTTSCCNTAVGAQALVNSNVVPSQAGWSNDAFGYETLYSNTGGYENDAFGYQAMYSNTTGNFDAAFGNQAMYSSTTGQFNAAFGQGALRRITSGNNNTAIGSGSGLTMDSSPITGNNNSFLGATAFMSTGSLSNATAVGACALVSASNAMSLGGDCGNGIANVGIDAENPSNILTVLQGGGHAIADGWDTYSSRRWKTNIHPLQDALSKVEQLRGVSYDLKASGKHEIGVIAEEVGAVVPEVVSFEENGKDARGVDYSRLTALLIEAVKQEQREMQREEWLVRRQAAAIRDLKSELRETRQSLQKVKAQMSFAQPALVARESSAKIR
jgi:hypothetical protein